MTKNKLYPDANQNLDFAKMEEQILRFWKDQKIFDKSVEMRNFSKEIDEDYTSPVVDNCALKDHSHCRHPQNSKNEFVFYDGPPFANGLPHYGHLLTGFIKDLVARYQTMKGKKVERRFGWDTHGLPVEMETEKELSAQTGKAVSGQIAIKEFGIEKFNNACQKSVMKYAGEWEHYVTRQGRFVDFKNSYKTMDLNYMESVLWAFKELYNKGLLYEDFRVVPYSWACQTPLSNFETRMDNAYRQKTSKTVKVKFQLNAESSKKLCNKIDAKFEDKTCFMVAWTTTPWTLPSNLALAVGEKIEYALLKKDQEILILAKNLIEKFAKDLGEHEVLASLFGSDLVGLSYNPIFPYFEFLKSEKIDKNINPNHKIFTVLSGDFVSTEDGTGIVHIAPGFGEDDQLLCKANGIPTICPVDEAGKFNNLIINKTLFEIFKKDYQIAHLPNLHERQVFETNDDIIKYLKEQKLIFGNPEQILHNYPHCWRTDTPLIYKAVSSWYVKVTAFKDRMVELNQQINWIPDNIKDGQFGKWLEGARDWSITRNRFWGCPVPVWKSKSGKIKVFGSIAELEKISGQKIDNLHRPFIDQITFEENGEKFERVSDVLDCWFESGSMPYAQVHYPFENKEWFEENFPADFITEYVAQTRGWFYTLMVLSTALFDRAPFKNVICHGTILDENSQKLSKRLRNYADPLEIFSTIGSDAMRFYMISQPVMRGQELRIDKDGKAIKDTLRLSIKPLVNAFNFFCLYANADGIKAHRIEFKKDHKNILDRYILAKLKSSTEAIDGAMQKFDTVVACDEFNKFFEVLNNWYIRRNRQRFWKSEIDQDKQSAYDVLYTVLLTMTEIASPLLPFTCEYVWQGLTRQNNL
ncbi:MAG: isoleucine--tRNA ligase [Proteobacteria bacterium]|nr:isoleucine--tRNA ligase [Pseudomonadota bacterium]